MKKKKKLSLLQKRALTGFAFITPWLIGFLWFYVKSLIQAVRFSLSKMEMLESGGYTLKFTGLDNFKYALFQDPTYNQILATSIRKNPPVQAGKSESARNGSLLNNWMRQNPRDLRSHLRPEQSPDHCGKTSALAVHCKARGVSQRLW